MNQLSINGVAFESVDIYTYFGTVLDDKLMFNDNTDAIFKKKSEEAVSSASTQKFGHEQ